MTVDEARAILKQSGNMASHVSTDDRDMGKTLHYKVGDFYKEISDGFGFAVYSHLQGEAIDPLWAFAYWVSKDSGEVVQDTSPIRPSDLRKLTPPS